MLLYLLINDEQTLFFPSIHPTMLGQQIWNTQDSKRLQDSKMIIAQSLIEDLQKKITRFKTLSPFLNSL